MPLLRLVSWKPGASASRAARLRQAGFTVDASPFNPSGMIGHLCDLAPEAVVIDLDHRPSHGMMLAVTMRASPTTRLIPIVFAGGAEEKIVRIRGELPDATFTTWEKVQAAVKRALRHRPAAPVSPPSHMERYAGAGLARKLGLKPATEVALLGPPDGFPELLGELAPQTRFATEIGGHTVLALWFVRGRRELEAETAYLAARLPEACGLWILYPKQSSRYKVDFNQKDVRAAGLAVGLVDFKVGAVDADWTGLRFARRRSRTRR
jgi:hypothetical protein